MFATTLLVFVAIPVAALLSFVGLAYAAGPKIAAHALQIYILFGIPSSFAFASLQERRDRAVWGEERSRKARSIIEQLDARAEHAPFVLYLRPFRRLDDGLEAVLSESLRPIGQTIAVGPDETFGAGKVFTDEATWRETVDRLARSAKRCASLDICGNLMPPAVVRGTLLGSRAAANAFDRAQMWSDVTHKTSKFGLRMPEYMPRGGVLVHRDGGWRMRLPTMWEQRFRFGLFARRIVADLYHERGECLPRPA